MPDISLCQDKHCPSGDDCYRFTADPKPFWQSYFMISPRSANDRSCEFFIDNREYEHESNPAKPD